MKRTNNRAFLFLIIVFIIVTNIQVYAKNDIISRQIIISNTDMKLNEVASVIINVENIYPQTIKILDVEIYNSNLSTVNEFAGIEMSPSEQSAIEIKVKAIREATTVLRVKITYTINGKTYVEYRDSSQFKIGKEENWIETFYVKNIKDIILPILIALISPIITQHVLSKSERNKNSETNINIIKSKLYYELNGHKECLGTNVILGTMHWENILSSDLYIFCLTYLPKQTSMIEYYYDQIKQNNLLMDKPTERFNKNEYMKCLNENIITIVKNLFNENSLFNRKKLASLEKVEIKSDNGTSIRL